MNFVTIISAIKIAIAIAPDVQALIRDLDEVIHKYVGPDVDKLNTDLTAVLDKHTAAGIAGQQ